MRNLKKAVASLLVIVMLLGTVAFAAQTPPDVIGTEYQESVTTLAALGVMIGRDDGTFDAEGDINRAEAAAVIIRMLGLEGSVAAAAYQPTMFNDCGKDVEWAWGYINLAATQGIINGFGDGTFAPTAKVTYEQMVKMLVCAVGYEPLVAKKGGWPGGYLVVAAEQKITSGVAATTGQPIGRGRVAQLAFNTLEVYLMEDSYIGSDGSSYAIPTTKTILKDKLEVDKYFGQLQSTELCSVAGERNNAGEITLKSTSNEVKVAKCSDITVNDLVGYSVIYYLQHNKTRNEDTAISVQEDKVKNKVITVEAENLGDSDFQTFKYWKDKINDREVTQLKLDATILVNGLVQASPTLDMLKPASGTVTVLDNNVDGTYDYVFVKQYINVVVDEVNTNRNYVQLKEGTAISLDPEKYEDYKFTIILDGEIVELKDLQEWDVLSIVADKTNSNGSVGNGTETKPAFETAVIYVTRNVVEATVEEVDLSAGNIYLVDSEGKTAKYKAGNGFDIASVDLSDYGRFYLDCEGKIAYADTTRKLGNYGYVVWAENVTKGGQPYIDLRILTKDGDVVDVSTTKNVQLNGARTLTSDFTVDAEQVIAFEVNSQGLVSSIDIAVDNHGGGYTGEFTLDWDMNQVRNQTTGYAGGAFGRYAITNETIVFEVPENGDEEDMRVVDKSAFSNSESYKVSIYASNKLGEASVVLYQPTTGKVKMNSALAIIDRIAVVENSKNVRVNRLSGYQSGAAISKMTTDLDVLGSAYSDVKIATEIKDQQGLTKDDPEIPTAGYGPTEKNFYEWRAAYNVAYSFFSGNLVLLHSDANNEYDYAMRIYPAQAPGLISFDSNGKMVPVPYTAYDNQYNPKTSADLEIIVGTVTEAKAGYINVQTATKDPDLAGLIADANDFYYAFKENTLRVNKGDKTVIYYVDTARDEEVRIQVKDNSFSNIEKDDTVVVRRCAGDTREVVIYKNYDVSLYNNKFVPGPYTTD